MREHTHNVKGNARAKKLLARRRRMPMHGVAFKRLLVERAAKLQPHDPSRVCREHATVNCACLGPVAEND